MDVKGKCNFPATQLARACGENCGESTKNFLFPIGNLAGQNTPHLKPPKFLMGKQIKQLVYGSSF
jgi:hypothetical protein